MERGEVHFIIRGQGRAIRSADSYLCYSAIRHSYEFSSIGFLMILFMPDKQLGLSKRFDLAIRRLFIDRLGWCWGHLEADCHFERSDIAVEGFLIGVVVGELAIVVSRFFTGAADSVSVVRLENGTGLSRYLAALRSEPLTGLRR